MEPIPPEQLSILAKDNQGPKVVGIVVAFTVLSLICVLLRFFARTRFTRLLGWEDYFVALSMVRPRTAITITICSYQRQVFSIATAACQLKQVESGAGKHQPLVDLPSTINSLRVHLTSCT
jgi:hypothetical protein